MKNPFVYGSVVSGGDFADRKAETESLMRDMRDCQKIFLISPRRYGKTSLIIRVLNELKKVGSLTACIDLYRATSLRDFFELYTNAVIQQAETKMEKAVRMVKDFLPGIRPKITFESTGRTVISLEYMPRERDLATALKSLFDLPENIASRKRKPFVLAIDEFQEIREIGGEKLEKVMRSAIQHHKRVGYLFAGSKRSIIHDMVNRKDRAFYRLGSIFNLRRIPRKEFSAFITRKFRRTGITIDKELANRILELVEDSPHHAQYLCHELWDHCRDRGRVKEADISPVMDEIISEETPLYVGTWDALTLHQRRALRAIALHGGSKIFSSLFMTENELAPSSTLQITVRLLQKKQIMEKENGIYLIADVFFKEWIKRKIA